MPREPDALVRRMQRAARAAIAPAVCDMAIITRTPLVIEVRDVPGQAPLTGVQRTTARDAALAVPTQRRRARPVAAIAADLETWASIDPTKVRRLAALALAVLLRSRPQEAQTAGVTVAGDEIDPT